MDNEILEPSQAENLRSQLKKIEKSDVSKGTDPEKFKERHSILTQLAGIEGKTELDVIKEEMNQINKKEKELSEAYQKEGAALNSSGVDKEKYDYHLKILEEYQSIGVSKDWIPNFSAQRIFLNTRKEQIENPSINPLTANSRALLKETELVEAKAKEIRYRDIVKYETLKNVSALMKAQAKLFNIVEIPKKPSPVTGK